MNFHSIDLNLLVAYQALIEERSVTRAADRVGLSQPAMSSALSRLRRVLDDPLFHRGRDGLIPTARTRELAGPVTRALGDLEQVLIERPRFEPERAALRLQIGVSDYPAHVLLPELATVLEAEAPGVDLDVHAFADRDEAIDLLDSGTIDVAIGVAPTQADRRIRTAPILRDHFVAVVRRDHPAATRRLDLEAYLSLTHILVSPEGDRHGRVDEVLARDGLERRIGITLSEMFAAPRLIAATDQVATLLSRVATSSGLRHELVLFPPPIELAEIEFSLIWHRRQESQPAQVWLRERVAALAGTLR